MSQKMRFDNLPNTRDLGGMKSQNGQTVRPGLLIRSGSLYRASDRDLEYLKSHVHRIVDFRTEQERNESPDPVMEGVEYIHIPLLQEKALGITRDKKSEEEAMRTFVLKFAGDSDTAKQHMTKLYTMLLSDEQAISGYAKFMHLFLNGDPVPTLWHCSAGKDRAGLAAMILLEALGVNRDLIIMDYLQTNECMKEEIEELAANIRRFQDNPGAEEAVYSLRGVRKEYIENIYQTAEELYGGFGRFLSEALGMTPEKCRILRKRYLV